MNQEPRNEAQFADTIRSADTNTSSSAFDAKGISDCVANLRVTRNRRRKLVATSVSACVLLAVTVGIVISFSNVRSSKNELDVVTWIDQGEAEKSDTLIPAKANVTSSASIDQELEELRHQQVQLELFAEQWESRRKQERLCSQTHVQTRQLALKSTLGNSIDVPDLPSFGF